MVFCIFAYLFGKCDYDRIHDAGYVERSAYFWTKRRIRPFYDVQNGTDASILNSRLPTGLMLGQEF